jgi:hypothetical protein
MGLPVHQFGSQNGLELASQELSEARICGKKKVQLKRQFSRSVAAKALQLVDFFRLWTVSRKRHQSSFETY